MQWEVEAIDPTQLLTIVTTAVDGYIDGEMLAAAIDEEETHRDRLTEFLRGWR